MERERCWRNSTCGRETTGRLSNSAARLWTQDPKDQTALYHLIQALRKTGDKAEIPDLLKRLAQLRKQTAHEESQRYQYKLVEEDNQPK